MVHPLTLLKGAGLGAGMMYFFDPVLGNRRRAEIRDKVMNACTVCDQQVGDVYRDATSRLEGAKSEISKAIHASDQPLMERVQQGATGLGRTLGMQGSSWSPTAKAAAVIGGASLVATLMSKRELAALAFGIVGLSMAAKEMSNQDRMQSEGNESGDQRQQPASPESSAHKQAPQGESRAKTPQSGKKQDTSNQSAESNEGAGMEASVSTKKEPIHNL